MDGDINKQPEGMNQSGTDNQNLQNQQFTQSVSNTSLASQAEPVYQPQIAPQNTQTNTAVHEPFKYTSNPFLVSIDGLIVVLKNNPVPALLANIALGLGMIGIVVICVLLALAHNPLTNILAVLIGMASYLFILPLMSGTSLATATASLKGEAISTPGSIKRAAAKLFPYIGLIILTSILVGLGFVLLIIPGLVFLVRSSLAPVVLFEENLGPVKAIKRSFALTKGHFFEMFGAMVAGGFLCSGGLLAFITSVTPLLGRYHQLNQLKESQAPKPKVHWLNYLIPGIIFAFVGVYIALAIVLMSFARKQTSTISSGFNSSYNSSKIQNTSEFNSTDFNY